MQVKLPRLTLSKLAHTNYLVDYLERSTPTYIVGRPTKQRDQKTRLKID